MNENEEGEEKYYPGVILDVKKKEQGTKGTFQMDWFNGDAIE